MRDHVTVCGLQGVGLRIVEQLHLSGTPVLVVDDSADSRFARLLEEGRGPGSVRWWEMRCDERR